jgi:hypothetical protein
MLPLIMLAAQLYSKHKQQEEARREEKVKLMTEKARMLGGNTMGVEAADFNRRLSQQNYASPQELMQIYGTFAGGGGGDKTPAESQALGADLAPNKTAYTLEQPSDTQLDTPDLLKDSGDYGLSTGKGSPFSLTEENDTTDPYYLKRMKLL